ncbi:Inherit from proNOG: methyltransferase Fkbm family [Seminavis robusta]|uniref:Inherit from proNOG: methyltransferase Fkbm family n=1 Tax=Seminavis robusta TaxID=568900 RepID=A0A9N8HT30_9STRA|nr:Inherit from proNOG: methyltransferase Fkbm family [Seminavis robusta]|eukprot:Sro1604_g285390.1 Inherit from proNOG: methyltransferase Fkbm family (371) ;mRNA; r:18009-19121
MLGWRIVQVMLLVLLMENLRRNGHQICAPTTTTAVRTTKSFRATDDAGSSSQYTEPLSDRVPAQGIETILATSATHPPFHFFAYAKKTDMVTAHIVQTGIYEKDSTTALVDTLVCQPLQQQQDDGLPMLVLDLGANIGFHSLHMASCGARVVAFEASPDTAWLLRSSAKLNGFWRDKPSPSENTTLTIIPRGASNKVSKGRLSRHPKSPGMTSFIAQSAFELQTGDKGTALDVDIPLVRAQDVLKEIGVSPDAYQLRLVKMDVEGFELQALQGLDLQQQFPFDYLTFEFFPAMLTSAGTGPVDLLVYIWKQGYRYLEFSDKNAKNMDSYPTIPMGNTEAAVRKWGHSMVMQGDAKDGKGFHVNLLVKRVA